MNKKEDNWEIQNQEYDIETYLRYRRIPITKKLEYLDETNEFFYKLTPKKNRLAWQKIKQEGY